ncbi:MAG: GNAT family N-acetyltransferase [Bryobacteraceae bacterium]
MIGREISPEQPIDLLNTAGPGERRPEDDRAASAAMQKHANLPATARDEDVFVGAARRFSRFACGSCCSSLCERESHPGRDIGKQLPQTVPLAAPEAVAHSLRIGFERRPSAWTGSPGGLR